ncbi:MAG: hypothetical protein K0S09_2157 [Sphingobacteriaceae bacterium]|jgi:hypothetical protein|nr:hypothetical protein [Sphingobacteriaceae bacterium]
MKTFISYVLILLMLAPVALAQQELKSVSATEMKCCTKMGGKDRQCHKQGKKKPSCPACASCPLISLYTIPQKTNISQQFLLVMANRPEPGQTKLSDFNSSVWHPPTADQVH